MSDPIKQIQTPPDLANKLFDAFAVQCMNDPREAARQVINFLKEALVYSIVVTSTDENAGMALLKSVGESISNPQLPPPPGKP
jgi:hypothetical protein